MGPLLLALGVAWPATAIVVTMDSAKTWVATFG